MAILQMKKKQCTLEPSSQSDLHSWCTVEPAPVAMETFPQGREPWTMNIAFQTEWARNLFEKIGFSDNKSSHLHSTLSFSPIVFLNITTLSQVCNLDLHFCLCAGHLLFHVVSYWRQGLPEIWYWIWWAGLAGKVLVIDDASLSSWAGSLETIKRLEGEI